jgi:hypothetical protein
VNTTTYTDGSVLPGDEFTYFVKAENINGEGVPSVEVLLRFPEKESFDPMLLFLLLIPLVILIVVITAVILIVVLINRPRRLSRDQVIPEPYSANIPQVETGPIPPTPIEGETTYLRPDPASTQQMPPDGGIDAKELNPSSGQSPP